MSATEQAAPEPEVIRDLVAHWITPRYLADCVLCPTQVAYGDGTTIYVRIARTPAGYIVSDDGQACDHLSVTDRAFTSTEATPILYAAAAERGLRLDAGCIEATGLSHEQLPAAVVHVAAASRAAADHPGAHTLSADKTQDPEITVLKDALAPAFGRSLTFHRVPAGIVIGTAFPKLDGDLIGFYAIPDNMGQWYLDGGGLVADSTARASDVSTILSGTGLFLRDGELLSDSQPLRTLPDVAIQMVSALLRLDSLTFSVKCCSSEKEA